MEVQALSPRPMHPTVPSAARWRRFLRASGVSARARRDRRPARSWRTTSAWSCLVDRTRASGHRRRRSTDQCVPTRPVTSRRCHEECGWAAVMSLDVLRTSSRRAFTGPSAGGGPSPKGGRARGVGRRDADGVTSARRGRRGRRPRARAGARSAGRWSRMRSLRLRVPKRDGPRPRASARRDP